MPQASTTTRLQRQLWVMLLALLSGFALSQAFRTITTIVAHGLQQDFGISASSLGAFAGLFGLSFGVVQLLMGIGMDLYGLRRTVLTAFPCAALGAALSAAAPSYGWLMLGQLLIGVGCSPAFLACTIFIARHFPLERFAFFSGLSMGIGGLGLLFTGTPLAWVVETYGWRSDFWLLALLCALSWLLIFWKVHEPALPQAMQQPRESWGQALRRMAELLTLPYTWGTVILGMSCYAAFLSLRGLWLGPLLMERHGFSLVSSGHVAFAVSLISLFTPPCLAAWTPAPWRVASGWPISRWAWPGCSCCWRCGTTPVPMCGPSWPCPCSRATACCSTPMCAPPIPATRQGVRCRCSPCPCFWAWR